jgi:amino acid adenylation domain-containing protein
LLAGRAYVPLNPKFPLGRNIGMIKRSKSACVILGQEESSLKSAIREQAGHELAFIIPGKEDLLNGSSGVSEVKVTGSVCAEDIAYMMFTSGTTGVPKGVPVKNRNVCSYLDHMLEEYDFLPGDRFSQTFDLTFDLSVHDLFLCWLSGACLTIPASDTALSFPRYINDRNISVWFSVPSMAVLMDKMRMLRKDYFPGLRLSFFCGEPLLERTARAWKQAAPSSGIINLYGPSETTIAISSYEWEDNSDNKAKNGIVSIGKIFRGHNYLILDEGERPVENGQQGFLHISGPQVIGGYLDDKDTEDSFKKLEQEDTGPWYNTGDLVEEDECGDLFFLGRADHEVKVSGFRVNLLAIDETMRRLSGTGNLATIALVEEKTGTTTLVTFIEKQKDEIIDKDLLSYCRNELPWYMVPQRLVPIDRLPLNVNGKIDRKKLAEYL